MKYRVGKMLMFHVVSICKQAKCVKQTVRFGISDNLTLLTGAYFL